MNGLKFNVLIRKQHKWTNSPRSAKVPYVSSLSYLLYYVEKILEYNLNTLINDI